MKNEFQIIGDEIYFDGEWIATFNSKLILGTRIKVTEKLLETKEERNHEDAYNDGYDDGFSEGRDEGYAEGQNEAYDEMKNR